MLRTHGDLFGMLLHYASLGQLAVVFVKNSRSVRSCPLKNKGHLLWALSLIVPDVHKNEKQVFSLLSHNIASQLVPDVWLGFFVLFYWFLFVGKSSRIVVGLFFTDT